MKQLIKNNKGFTLVELMIAMAIFVIFLMVLINAYVGVVRSFKETNDYRVLYSEARYAFDRMIDEVRDSVFYYPPQGTCSIAFQNDRLKLLSKDGKEVKVFEVDDVNEGLILKEYFSDTLEAYVSSEKIVALTGGEVKVSAFEVRVDPQADPYRAENVQYDKIQFQPRVYMKATFEKELRSGKTYQVVLETTVSSRYYGPSIEVETPEICNL